jgi:putative hydrolase of the HAD superfamily
MEAKAVILDYGGVICFHPPPEEVDELVARTGVPKDVFLESYWGLRADYDRGDLSYQEYWGEFARRTGRSYSAAQVEEFVQLDVHFWLHVDTRMLAWVRTLKASGRKVAMLSNMPRELGEYMKSHLDWLGEFDHLTLSYELRSVKPEAAIYRDAVDGLGVHPEEAVFIDDRAENIEAAEALGIRALLFESAEAFSRSARNAGQFLGLGSAPVVFE